MASFKHLASGRWQYRISVGSGDNRQQFNGTTDAAGHPLTTLKSAKLAANEIESNTLRGIRTAGDRSTLFDYYTNWVATYKKGKHSTSTDEWYVLIGKYIKEYFGDTKLRTVDRKSWQTFINYLQTNPRGHRKKPLAHSTIRRVNSYGRAVALDAVEDGIITRDFTRHIDLGEDDSKPADEKFLNQAEFTDVLALAAERADMQHMSNYILFTMGMLGLRFEEAIGLSWDRIDWDNKIAHIDRSWNYKSRKQTDNFGGLKNKASYRTLPIPDNLLTMLEQLHDEQAGLFKAQRWTDPDNLVFRNFYHRIVDNNAVNDTLKRLCKATGAHITITSHGLRHTHGSVLLYNGVELIAVSRRLGHADMQTTIKTYAHEISEMQMREDTKTNKVLDSLKII